MYSNIPLPHTLLPPTENVTPEKLRRFHEDFTDEFIYVAPDGECFETAKEARVYDSVNSNIPLPHTLLPPTENITPEKLRRFHEDFTDEFIYVAPDGECFETAEEARAEEAKRRRRRRRDAYASRRRHRHRLQ